MSLEMYKKSQGIGKKTKQPLSEKIRMVYNFF